MAANFDFDTPIAPPTSVKKKPAQFDFDERAVKEPEDNEYQRLMKAFNELPWYKQGAVAADDIVRTFASGVTMGALDDRLGPEHAQAVKEARIRAGLAGVGGDITGMVASPVTRAVGYGAQAIKPVGKGIMKMLGRLGVDIGEGAALSGTAATIGGRPEQVIEDAKTGGIINAIAPRALQAVGKAGKYGAGFMTGTDPAKFTKAFEAGADIDISKAFRLGQQGKQPVAADVFRAAEQKFNRGFQNLDSLKQAKADLKAKYITPKGKFDGTKEEKNAYYEMMKILEKQTGVTTREAESLRRNLGSFTKKESPVIKDIAITLQDSLIKTAGKNQPGYEPALNKFLKSEEAYRAGKGLTRMLPDKLSLPAAASLTGFTTAAALGSPLALIAATALASSSPRLSGFTANKIGEAVGNLRKGGLTPSNVGILSYIARERSRERRKRNKGQE